MTLIKEISDSNFESEVLNSDKVVVAYFSAPWCAPCVRLKPTLEKFASMNDIKVCKIDTDECPIVTDLYNIRSVPTLIWFKNAIIVKTNIGLIQLSMLEDTLQEIENEQ